MANRVEIPIVVLSDSSPTSPVSGASAVIKNRATSTEATVFSDSGATNNVIIQPLTTDSTGKLTGWLPRGIYEVLITIPGKTAYAEYLDVAPGADGSVDTAWIASNAVTGPKIATDAVESQHIKENAVGSSELGGGTVTAGKLGLEAVESASIKNLAITTPKVADGAVTLAKLAASSKPFTWYTPKVIPAEETRTNTAYGKLTTPDEIQGVVVPTGSLVVVGYSALWKSSLGGTNGRAAIFIGTNQLKYNLGTQEAYATTVFSRLATQPGGLGTISSETPPPFNSTGEALGNEGIGGFCFIQRLEAGTYTISIQYRAVSSSVTARERILWVGVLGV